MNREELSSKELEVASHIKGIMSLLGIKETPSNTDTPYRIAKMYNRELFKNEGISSSELDDCMTTFDNEGSTPVIMKGIKFSSMCEHHWLPFFGEVEMYYVPNDYILGLSKFPRVVAWFSARPQTQESLTKDIGEYLVRILKPHKLIVRISAVHTCVTCRGIRSTETQTETVFEYDGEDA